DAIAKAITNPSTKICVSGLTPAVDIMNNGKDPLTSVRIVYRITGPASFNLTDSVNWTGNLLTGGIANVPLKPVTLTTPGPYNILSYTKLLNNVNDQLMSNDTTRSSFRVIASLPAPLFEGFESGSFPPPNWS